MSNPALRLCAAHETIHNLYICNELQTPTHETSLEPLRVYKQLSLFTHCTVGKIVPFGLDLCRLPMNVTNCESTAATVLSWHSR